MDNQSIQAGSPNPEHLGPTNSQEHPLDGISWRKLEKDKNDLNLLSIFYFILAGLQAVGGMISLCLFPLGLLFMTMTPPQNITSDPPPAVMGGIVIGFGFCSLLLNATYGYFLYLAGKGLRRRQRRTLIFVVAIVLCVLGGVIGIVLGVFTIVVLSRESVKALFEHGEPTPSQIADA